MCAFPGLLLSTAHRWGEVESRITGNIGFRSGMGTHQGHPESLLLSQVPPLVMRASACAHVLAFLPSSAAAVSHLAFSSSSSLSYLSLRRGGSCPPLHPPIVGTVSTNMAMREGEGMLQMPSILYGTAWKKESTAALVEAAVLQGFRGIDTACQPKHYNEAGVGEGWSRAAASLALDREDFFLQTKYTPIDGQDPERVPYDSSAPLGEQVKESIAVSLANLRTSFVDSLVLHSPLRGDLERTLEVWAALEDTVKEGKARMIGISNCYDLELLKSLCERVNILPAVVQNRFYATSGFDTDLRAFCTAKGIQYQSFWTLTGNREALQGPAVAKVASDVGLSPQQTMFAFVRALGIVPLSGTQSEQHMREDLEVIALCSAESERQQQEQEEEEEGGGGAGAGGGGGRGERGERGETGVLSALQMQDMAAALGVTLPPPPSDAPAGS